MKPEKLEEAHPEAEAVEHWAEDEARLGLKPVLVRRVWAPVGKRPIARAKRGYKWTYLYGFVRPESGEVFWLILPTVDTELFSMAALKEFAKEVGAGKGKRVLFWWWTRPGGTPASARWRSPKGYTWRSSCPRARRSLCRRRGCGR